MNARFFIYATMVMAQVLGSVFGFGSVTVNQLFSVNVAQAAEGISHTINYQGKLMDATGNLVADGDYDMQFTVYDAATGGTQLWTSTSTNQLVTGTPTTTTVTVQSGLFSILLGDTSDNQLAFPDSLFNNDTLYLGITIGSDTEMTPRKRLSAVPYAYNSEMLQGQYASSSSLGSDANLFALNQASSSAAYATRTALYIETQGGDNEKDFLVRGSNDGTNDVFSISRQGNIYTTGTLNVVSTSTFSNISLSGRVDSGLLPYTTYLYDLGSSAYRWKDIWASSTLSGNVGIGTDAPNGLLDIKVDSGYSADLVGSGTASASSYWIGPGYDASQAFDNQYTTNDIWFSDLAGGFPQWLKYDFGSGNGKAVTRYRIFYYDAYNQGYNPGTWQFQGSNNDVDWDTLDSQAGYTSWTYNTWKTFNISNTTAYRYYRIYITANGGAATQAVNINEVELIESLSEEVLVDYDGNLTATASTTLNHLTLTGRVDSNLLPYITDTYYLGNSTYRWKGLTVGNVSSTNIDALNYVSTTNLYIGGSLFTGDLQSVTDLGNITTNPIGVAGVSSTGNILPTATLTYDLGSTSRRFKDVWASSTYIGASTWNLRQNGSGYFTVAQAPGAERMTIDTSGNVGIGTTNPLSKLHLSEDGGTVSTALYSAGNDSFIISKNNAAPAINIISSASSAAQRGVFKATRSRGTVSSPTVPLNNDYVFSLLGAIYDGSTNIATAGVEMLVDGTVSAGVAPQRIGFFTGETNSRTERLTIKANGNVGIGDTTPASPLTVGNGDTFQVNSSGNLIKINNVDYSWPGSQGAANTYLKNDGSGNFSWVTVAGGTAPSWAEVTLVGATSSKWISFFGATSTGNIVPGAGSQYNLGSSAYRWNSTYAVDFNALPTASTLSLVTSTATGGSNTHDVKIVGKYAYVINYTGATFSILDISNPIYTKTLGTVAVSSTPYSIEIQGKYAYVANNAISPAGAVNIIDISNPNLPVIVATIIGGAYGIPAGKLNVPKSTIANGDYLYVGNWNNALWLVINITDPTSPYYVRELSFTNSPYSMALRGNNLYVGGNGGRFNVYDVSNGSNPVLRKTLIIGSAVINDIELQGNYAYIADTSNYLRVVDITSSTNPTLSATLASPSSPFGVTVSGRYAYVTKSGASQIEIIDVSVPTGPVSLGTFATTGSTRFSSLSGRYLYVADYGASKLDVIDIKGAEVGGLLAHSAEFGTSRTLGNSEVYGNMNVGDKLTVSGLTWLNTLQANATSVFMGNVGIGNINPSLFKLQVTGNVGPSTNNLYDLGSSAYRWNSTYAVDFNALPTASTLSLVTSTATGGSNTHDVKIVGKYAYVINYTGATFSILDISNPIYTKTLGTVAVSSTPYSIEIQGKYAYVANNAISPAGAVNIIDISNPNLPVIVATIIGGAYGIPAGKLNVPKSTIANGDYLYVGNWNNALWLVINITDPTSPYYVRELSFTNAPYSMALRGNNLYVGGNVGRFNVYDVSNGSNPVLRKTLIIGSAVINDIELQGNYAYIADTSNYLRVVDITSSTNPTLSATLASPSSPFGVTVSGRYAYVTKSGASQIEIIDVSVPTGPVSLGTFATTGSTRFSSLSGRYLYVANYGSSKLDVINIKGAEFGGLLAHSAEFGTSRTLGNSEVYGNMNVGDKLTVSGLTWLNILKAQEIFSIGNLTVGGNTIFGGVEYTWPGSDGLSGNVLKTDGSGNLSWGIYDNISVTSLTLDGYTCDPEGVGACPADHEKAHAIYNTRGVFVNGDYAYAVGEYDSGFEIFDISDTNNPVSVGYIEGDTTHLNSAFDIFVSGNYAYVVGSDQFSVIDVSKPEKPVVTDTITNATHLTYLKGVYVQGKYAYVTSYSDDRLVIIDITNPGDIAIVGYLAGIDGAWDVEVRGDFAYVTAYDGDRLIVADVSDPTNPQLVGTLLDNAGTTYLNGAINIDVIGAYAYVTGFVDDGFNIIDISSTTAPVLVGSLLDDGSNLKLNGASGVKVSGNYAYIIGDDDNGIEVVDISSSTNPTHVTSYTNATILDNVNSIYVANGKLFVGSSRASSLSIYNIPTFTAPSAIIGDLSATNFTVYNDAFLNDDLYVAGSILAGPGGIYSDGGFFANSTSSMSTILPNTNNLYDLGSTTYKWRNIYASAAYLDGLYLTGEFTQSFANNTTLTSYGPVALGGTGYDVAIQGRYAYVNRNGAPYYLQIYDITNPTSPTLLKQAAYSVTGATHLEVQGDYVYSVGGGYLYVMDVSDPGNATQVYVGNVFSSTAYDLKVRGHYLYVAQGAASGGIIIFDITDPSSPTFIKKLTLSTGSNWSHIYVDGSYAYMVGNDSNRFAIVDITDPFNPVEKYNATTNISGPSEIQVKGRYAYIGNNTSLRIFDIASSTNPFMVKNVALTNTAHSVRIEGDYVYTGNTSGYYTIVNVKDAPNSYKITERQISGAGSLTGLDITGKYAVAVGGTNLYTLDLKGADFTSLTTHSAEAGSLNVLTDAIVNNNLTVRGGLGVGVGGLYTNGPLSALATTSLMGKVGIGTLTPNNFKLQVAGDVGPNTNYAYNLGSLTSQWQTMYAGTFLAQPAQNAVLTSYGPVALGGNGYDVAIQGRYAYVNRGSYYMQIYDVTNPTAPTLLSQIQYSALTFVSHLEVQGDYVYAVGGNANKFFIIDVSDPGNPAFKGSITSWNSTPYDIKVRGQYAYVCEGAASGGLNVIDITDPNNPVRIKRLTLSTGSNWSHIYIDGSYAYLVGNDSNRFAIVDITDPYNPVEKYNATTNISAPNEIQVKGRYAYIGGGASLRIFDIASSTNPFMVKNVALTNTSYSVRVEGDYVYTGNTGGYYAIVNVKDAANAYKVTEQQVSGAGTFNAFDISGRYAIAVGGTNLYALELKGADVASLVAHSAEAGSLNVLTNAIVNNNLSVRGAISAGVGGFYTNGPMSAYATTSLMGKVGVGVLNPTNFKLQVAGDIGPNANLTYDLGSTTYQWRNTYSEKMTALPSQLTLMSTVTPAGDVRSVKTQGRYMYTLENYNSFRVYDVQDVSYPRLLSSLTLAGDPIVMTVSGNYAFLARSNSAGLQVVDISDPGKPVLTSTLTSGVPAYAYDMYADGKYLYVTYDGATDAMYIYNIENPSSVSIVGNTPSYGGDARGVAVQGKYAYMTEVGTDSLRIFDISTPSTPVFRGYIDLGTIDPTDVVVSGDYAYVGDSSYIRVIDISSSTAPVLKASLAAINNQALHISGNYLYAGGSSNLYTIDVSSSTAPSIVETIGSVGTILDIEVAGRYLYAARYNTDQIRIYDVKGAYVNGLIANSATLGNLQVQTDSRFNNKVDISGALTVGNQGIYTNGQLSVQATSTFTNLQATGRVNSNWLPYIDNTYFLGNATYRWKGLYAASVTTTNLTVNGVNLNNAFIQNGNSFGTGAVLGTNDGNSLSFETANTSRLTLDTSGNLYPVLNNTYNLGSTSNAFKNAYFASSVNIGFKGSPNVRFPTTGYFTASPNGTSGINGIGFAFVVTSTLSNNQSLFAVTDKNYNIAIFAKNATTVALGSDYRDGFNVTLGGHTGPRDNLVYDLGSSSYRWKDLWVSSTYIGANTWNIRQKGGTDLVFAPVGGPEVVKFANDNILLQGVDPVVTIKTTDDSTAYVDFVNSGAELGYVGFTLNDFYITNRSASNAVYIGNNNTAQITVSNNNGLSPVSTDVINLGTTSYRWKQLHTKYASTTALTVTGWMEQKATAPTLKSSITTSDSSVWNLGASISGNLVAISMYGNSKIGMYRINPDNTLTLLKNMDFPGVNAIKFIGSRMFVTTENGGFYIADIANIDKGDLLGSIEGTGNGGKWMDIVGDYAYIAKDWSSDEFEIYDISDPSNIQNVGGYSTTTIDFRNIKVKDNFLYTVSYSNSSWHRGLMKFDITNPKNVVYSDNYQDDYVVAFDIVGDIAYTINTAGTLRALDLSGDDMTLIGSASKTVSGYTSKLIARGNMIYVLGDNGYLSIYKHNGGSNFETIYSAQNNTYWADAKAMDISGNKLIVHGGSTRTISLWSLNGTTLDSMEAGNGTFGSLQVLDDLNITSDLIVAGSVHAIGGGLFDGNSSFRGGVELVPSISTIKDNYAGIGTAGASIKTITKGNTQYTLSNNGATLYVSDISDPNSIYTISSLALGYTGYDLYITGQRAYITRYDATNKYQVSVYDITNPSSVVLLSTFQVRNSLIVSGSPIAKVRVDGSYIYTMTGTTGGGCTLNTIDNAETYSPYNMDELILEAASYTCQDMVIKDGYLYALSSGYLRKVSVVNPKAASIVASSGLATATNYSLDINGYYAYVWEYAGLNSGNLRVYSIGGASITGIDTVSASGAGKGQIKVIDNYAVVISTSTTSGVSKLHMFNIEQPTDVRLVSTSDLSVITEDVTTFDISGNTIFAATTALGRIYPIDLNGFEAHAASIGSLETQYVNVKSDLSVDRQLDVFGNSNFGGKLNMQNGGSATSKKEVFEDVSSGVYLTNTAEIFSVVDGRELNYGGDTLPRWVSKTALFVGAEDTPATLSNDDNGFNIATLSTAPAYKLTASGGAMHGIGVFGYLNDTGNNAREEILIPTRGAAGYFQLHPNVTDANALYVTGGSTNSSYPTADISNQGTSSNSRTMRLSQGCVSLTQPTVPIFEIYSSNGGDREFYVQCDGATYADGAYTGTGADYAEYMRHNNETFTTGDVVALDASYASSVKLGSASNRGIVVGVISDRASVIGNTPGSGEEGETIDPTKWAIVGMLGQVPVKFSNSNGSVAIGDKLMAGDNGYAVKASGSGMILGEALEASAVDGTITVYLHPQYWAGDLLTSDGGTNYINDNLKIKAKGISTTSTEAFDSYTFSFMGSAWNTGTAQEITTSFDVFNNTISATSSELKFIYSTGTSFTQNLLTITNAGDVHVSGDLHVGRRLYLGSKSTGESSTSTYIFVDDTLAPTSTYIATNADGWQTETTYDYAERYESTQELVPGDLVTADPSGVNLVKRATSPSEPLLGIVSTKPGFVTGRHYDGWHPVALAGRVPTRVSTMNGAIKAGDYIAASDIPGVGIKATGAGNVVGVALESYDSPEEGLISVFVKPSFSMGSISTSGASAGTIINQTIQTSVPDVEIEGLALIKAGATEVHISYGTILHYSMVYATPHASIDGSWWVGNRTDTGFDIILSQPQGHDTEFTWLSKPMNPGTIRFVSDNTYQGVDDLTGQPIGPTLDELLTTTSTDLGTTTSTDPVVPDFGPATSSTTTVSSTDTQTDAAASSTWPVTGGDAATSTTQNGV